MKHPTVTQHLQEEKKIEDEKEEKGKERRKGKGEIRRRQWKNRNKGKEGKARRDDANMGLACWTGWLVASAAESCLCAI